MSKEFKDTPEQKNTARIDVSNEARNSKTGYKTAMSSGTHNAGDSYRRNI